MRRVKNNLKFICQVFTGRLLANYKTRISLYMMFGSVKFTVIHQVHRSRKKFNSRFVRFTAHWKDYGRFKLIVNPKFIWFFLKFYLDSHISRFGFAQLGLGIFVRQLMQIENAYLYKGMQKVRKWALFWRLKFYLNFEKNSWISISNFSSVQKSTDEIEWYTLRTPDVSGHHCPCHISLSRFCPDFPKLLFGVCCLDSVRVFVLGLPVSILSVICILSGSV